MILSILRLDSAVCVLLAHLLPRGDEDINVQRVVVEEEVAQAWIHELEVIPKLTGDAEGDPRPLPGAASCRLQGAVHLERTAAARSVGRRGGGE